jgi:hypothetical protein
VQGLIRPTPYTYIHTYICLKLKYQPSPPTEQPRRLARPLWHRKLSSKPMVWSFLYRKIVWKCFATENTNTQKTHDTTLSCNYSLRITWVLSFTHVWTHTHTHTHSSSASCHPRCPSSDANKWTSLGAVYTVRTVVHDFTVQGCQYHHCQICHM